MKPKNLLTDERTWGHLMFLVLFVLAVVYYLERTIFVDPCYAVFNLIYYKSYIVEAGRTTAVYPQTLALLAIRWGWPLKSVLAVYSVSFILLYYIIYLVIAYIFRLRRLALAVPLALLLGVKYSFFWISTETHQAVAYTILFYAFLAWSAGFRPGILYRLIRVVAAAGILYFCFHSHPVALFTVLFALGFFIVENKFWLKPDGYILAGIIIAMAVAKFLAGSSVGYESFFFKGFGEFFDRLGNIFGSESFRFLKGNITGIYLFSALLFVVTTAWYIMKKQYLKLVYYLTAILAFSLILFTTFNIWFFPFIQEKNLMGLNVFLLIPFLRDVEFGGKKSRYIVPVMAALIFLTGVFRVVRASAFYRDRLDYIGSLIRSVRDFPEKKFVIPAQMISRERLNVNWGLATESLMLSSLESPDSSVSIYVNDDDGKIPEGTNFNDSLLFICAPWAKDLEIRRLDRRYFDLRNSPYRVLEEKDMVQGGEVGCYSNRFDDPAFRQGNDGCTNDGKGNTYFLLTSEFSPGFYGKYSDMTHSPAVMVTARVRVCPMEKLNPEWLTLVISREKEGTVLEYHRSGLDKTPDLRVGQWDTLTASGIIRSTDPADQLKVYLWNPEKKKVGMDDLEISYKVLLQTGK